MKFSQLKKLVIEQITLKFNTNFTKDIIYKNNMALDRISQTFAQ